MKIEMAQNSGFCMGVRKAVLRIVNELNSSDDKIYMYGSLIHNPQTIEVLKNRGLITDDLLDDLNNKVVAIRTHGIPVDENKRVKKNAARTINLTCSRVARVQSIIKKYSSEGYYTIIIGDKEHAEVIGLKSYASASVHVVSNSSDINKIEKAEKYIIVSQTTYERNHFNKLVDDILKKYKNIKVIDTICDSTRLRQEDVKQGIERGIDTLVVVGGKNSANTRSLAKIGLDNGIKTFHIETDNELKKDDFKGREYILVTAGTSTPGWIINNVLEKLYIFKNESRNIIIKVINHYLQILIRSNIISSIAALFMVLIAQVYAGISIDIQSGIIAALFIFVMYSVNNFLDRKFLIKSNPYKYNIYDQYGVHLIIVSIITFFLSIYLSMQVSLSLTLLLLVPYIFGLIYSTQLTKNVVKNINIDLFKKIYNTKIVTGFGWIVAVVVIPYLEKNVSWDIYLSAAIYFFLFIFTRHLIIDFAAFQGDLILGRDTLPTWLGVKKVAVLTYIIIAIGSLFFIAISITTGRTIFLVLLLCIIYYALLLNKIQKADYLISIKYEVVIDFNYIILISLFFVIKALLNLY
jgi:4-hydroxy-3-methylbut-2-enyl diphosphate reductase